MFYAILLLFLFGLTGVALFYFLRSNELNSLLHQASEEWRQREDAYTSELNKLEKLRHIPDVIEKSRRAKEQAEAKLADADRRADQILQQALVEAQAQSQQLREETERQLVEDREASKVARWQAQNALDEARKEARELASNARKDAKEKKEKGEATLSMATEYAQMIRQKAEQRAKEIAGEAYEAKGKLNDYQAAAQALKNRIGKCEGIYMVPPAHILDELADEFGFSKAGEKLKLARETTKLIRRNGRAAICDYPDGWKKEHALKFVLNTFDGKVDTILSRVKSGNQGKLIQEIRDAYAMVNKDGEVYKNARIEKEYLDSRLEEIKWAAAVQKLKEKTREEQRAIKEQIREEEKAKREIERALKQAAREEELVSRAIERVRKQVEEASGAEKAKFEAQLMELNSKLAEAEEKARRAISLAQQTKKGHVYIISNVGSFGENVYKIGLTRRLDPTERVRELGDASVPFPFDVHAMIDSDDAPALESALHRRFVERQMNKINKRKEFFRVSLTELGQVIEELGIVVSWTLAAAASQYRETLALEQAMRTDAGLKKKWMEDQATLEFDDESLEEADDELEQVEA
jgi:hypothetical protein